MNTDSHTATVLQTGLLEAQSRAENGEYKSALDSVRVLKSAHPRNIYVLALEKQLEQLHQLSTSGQLTEEQKVDILESLPGIVERALDGQGAELSSGQTAIYRPLTEEAIRQKDEKAAALEWLKNQYFQHAHEYVRKGEYENALAEIRRVFIIDPSNHIATDFESQIRQLSELKRIRHVEPPPPPRPDPPPPAAAPPAVPEAVHREHISRAPQPVPAVTPVSAAPVEVQPKKRMSNWVVAAILLTIVVIGGAAFYFITRPHRVEKIKIPASVTPTGDAIFAPPTTTQERTFVISSNPEEQVAASAPPQGEEPAEEPAGTPADSRPAESAPPTRIQESQTRDVGPRSSPAAGTLPPQNPPSTSQGSGPEPAAQEESTAEPFIVVEQPPQIIKLEKPRFSDAAYRQGLEGQVVVQVQIDAEGRPQQAKVLTSSNPLLEEGILDAVLRSQFSPGRMSTGPVASSIVIPFRFRR